MTAVLALLILALSCASCYGWGKVVRRASASSGPWATTLGLGLALILALGGVVNLLHISYSFTLWAIFGTGLILFVFEAKSFKWHKWSGEIAGGPEFALTAAFLLLVIIFTISTQLPPSAFNIADDFEKYFTHPVRMLETGTLLGSPFNVLGSTTLGGQAFLQGFVLSVFPLPYINGVDAVFGLTLLLFLAASAGWRRFSPIPGALIGPLAILMIEPQSVNVSALFVAAALIATEVMLVADDRESAVSASPLAIGVVQAALISVKSSLILFVAMLLIALIPSARAREGSWWAGGIWTLKSSWWTALFISPWILLHLPNYLKSTAVTQAPLRVSAYSDGLFSFRPTNYGINCGHYSVFLAVMATLAAVIAGLRWHRERSGARSKAVILGAVASQVTVIGVYFAVMVVFDQIINGALINLRYAVPVFLGATVIPLLASCGGAQKISRAISWGIPGAVILTSCLIFGHSFIGRVRQATQYGSIFIVHHWAQNGDYLRYMENSLSPSAAKMITDLQAKVPSGKPLLAWIDLPFYLDYRRNPVHNVEPEALVTPWGHLSCCEYVLTLTEGYRTALRGGEDKSWWNLPGRHLQLTTALGLSLRQSIERAAEGSEVLYQDDKYILYRDPHAASGS